MHLGKLRAKYWSSSGDDPGQLVNSSSSSDLSWARPDRPAPVSNGQPVKLDNKKEKEKKYYWLLIIERNVH